MAKHRLILTTIEVIKSTAITIMMNYELTITIIIIITTITITIIIVIIIHLYIVGVIVTIGLTKLPALLWSRSELHSFSLHFFSDQKHRTKDKKVI